MADVKALFAQNTRVLRKSANLSQMRLAELCELSTKSIQQIEAGRKFPTVGNFERIADVLGVEPYQLLLEPHAAPTTPTQRHAALWALDQVESEMVRTLREKLNALRQAFETEP